MNTNSLNKINNLLYDFSKRCQLLNDYSYGTTNNIGASRSLKFPYMWVFLLGTEYTDNGLSEIYHFQIYYFDKITFNDAYPYSNILEIHSDMQLVYRMLFGELFRSSFWDNLNIQVLWNRTNQKIVNYATDQNVTGWVMDLYLKEPVTLSYYNTPLLPATVPQTTTTEGIDYWIVENDFIVS